MYMYTYLYITLVIFSRRSESQMKSSPHCVETWSASVTGDTLMSGEVEKSTGNEFVLTGDVSVGISNIIALISKSLMSLDRVAF